MIRRAARVQRQKTCYTSSANRPGMKFRFPRPSYYLLCATTLTCACVHTPPGTSVEIALAKKAELVRLPAPPPPPPGQVARSGVRVPAVEPDLPTSDTVERVADAYSRGQFSMKTGNDEDAIQAFLEVVAIDPKFSDAWHNLAALYEKTGQDEKALDAFRKSKNTAQH